jgi:hypothetical protein
LKDKESLSVVIEVCMVGNVVLKDEVPIYFDNFSASPNSAFCKTKQLDSHFLYSAVNLHYISEETFRSKNIRQT